MPQNFISFFKPCIYGTENIWAVQMKGNIILENHNAVEINEKNEEKNC